MTTTIVDGITKGGGTFLYSVGLSEFARPELVFIVGPGIDTGVDSGIPGVMATLVSRATALALAGTRIDNDEVVRVEWCGMRFRLRTVDWHPDAPMPRFVQRYGFEPSVVTEVSVLPGTDA